MSGPWEKYQAQDGPWTKYAAPTGELTGADIAKSFQPPENVLSTPEGQEAMTLAGSSKRLGWMLPTVGGLIGTAIAPGPGTAIGAGLGEIARQGYGIVAQDPNTPRTPLAAGLNAAGQTLMAGLPEVSGVATAGAKTYGQIAAEKVASAAGAVGRGAAKVAQAFSGGKANDYIEAAKRGVGVYAAPSVEDASAQFGQAMAKEGIPAKPPLESILDPQLTQARSTALEVGTKMQNGAQLTAQEALQGRQAVDRIYAATPYADKATLNHLADLRTQFDEVLKSQSGPLADASKAYRDATLKQNLTKILPVNKRGDYSRLVPMLSTLASTAGAMGHSPMAALGSLGYLVGTAPATMGAASVAAGMTGRAAGQVLQPEILRPLLAAYAAQKYGRQP